MFDFLKKLLYGEEKHDRTYHFPLPYKILAVYLHYGIVQLKQEGVFHKLPRDMQQKWTRASEQWHDIRVTKEDLDRIDDDTWSRIAQKLNLKWE